MADIRHRVGIAAPQTRVYQAVATREGLSGWRTREVDGDPGVVDLLERYERGEFTDEQLDEASRNLASNGTLTRPV